MAGWKLSQLWCDAKTSLYDARDLRRDREGIQRAIKDRLSRIVHDIIGVESDRFGDRTIGRDIHGIITGNAIDEGVANLLIVIQDRNVELIVCKDRREIRAVLQEIVAVERQNKIIQCDLRRNPQLLDFLGHGRTDAIEFLGSEVEARIDGLGKCDGLIADKDHNGIAGGDPWRIGFWVKAGQIYLLLRYRRGERDIQWRDIDCAGDESVLADECYGDCDRSHLIGAGVVQNQA